MCCSLFYYLLLTSFIPISYTLWENEKLCPLQCTCYLQHLTETSIYRYTQQDKEAEKHQSEAFGHENNEVLYDDDFIATFEEAKSILRTAVCMIQTETELKDLLRKVQKDVNALTLIQGSDSGNKTLKASDLVQFQDLLVLELQGVKLKEQQNASNFVYEVDASLTWLEYLNLERVTLKNSLRSFRVFDKDEEVTVEYVKKFLPNSKPIAFVKKGPPTEILPYKEYVEQMKNNFASFKGFESLVLLRISDCDLNTLYWEIFEGLSKLEYLILDRNHLKFIPDFAFYGAPKLKSLSLAHNYLLNIQLTHLAGLLELEYLDLSHNNFSELSELSLPPFPKLKLANFGDNPVTVIFPNTFEVLNTTDSIILGSEETPLSLLTNSFVGLKLLKKLTIRNLKIKVLQKEILVGMPSLKEFILTGDIPKIDFDAFMEVNNLEKLIMNQCNISRLSVDTFMGLNRLKILDLSKNNIDFIPPGLFDILPNLRELYLSNNHLKEVSKGIFPNTLRLIRLDNNPWQCSCDMSDWKPMIINRIKRKIAKICNQEFDKGISCGKDTSFTYTYIFEPKVAPKCASPPEYINHSVFHVMRKQFKCSAYKPKLRKIKKQKNTSLEVTAKTIDVSTENSYVSDEENNFNNKQSIETNRHSIELNRQSNELHRHSIELNRQSNDLNTFLSSQNNRDVYNKWNGGLNFSQKSVELNTRNGIRKKKFRKNSFGKIKKVL
ncbi:toll-like receptor 13 [Onthophagus taurus]|uniref:toll-like receptor 13 n=1 Tax=Onthophagus taurus TaxID=166361 RepID=UPI000C208CE8|nr:podocan-like [Onthophagus taurus]